MAALPALLADYGAYHRDSRNRLTHYFGVPAIIYAILIVPALHAVTLAGVAISLERLIVIPFVVFYLLLDLQLGVALALVFAALCAAAEATTRLGANGCEVVAGVVFILGWALQFFGHHLEGNRPALLTNLFQILVAPIFLTAELAFGLGLRPGLRAQLERRLSGPAALNRQAP
ncbi:MAG TPA: Mpo1-like protein [Steroidobacteraceae bacterium]|nr:Mpo1-like protein [Steroidobacteraceae bacterium]